MKEPKRRRALIDKCVKMIFERVKDNDRDLEEFIYEVVEENTDQELRHLYKYK